MKNSLVFIGIGFELLGIILAGLYLGQKIDQHMNWPGYALIVLVFGGLIGWMVRLTYLLKRFSKDNPDDQAS